MSHTITHARRVAAVQGSRGPVYFLFEKTCSSNVSPRIPTWSCVHAGDLASSLKEIFDFAGACATGGLQSKNGPLTPEGYLATWFKEMAAPKRIIDAPVVFRASRGERDWSGYGKEAMERVAGIAPDSDGVIRLSPIKDADLLAAFVSGKFSSYSFGLSHDERMDADPALGYRPQAAKDAPAWTEVAFKKIGTPFGGDSDHLVKEGAGPWRLRGWGVFLFQAFIEGEWKAECSHPGSWRKRIKAYRAALDSAPMAPPNVSAILEDGTIVEVDEAFLKECGREDREKKAKIEFLPGFSKMETLEALMARAGAAPLPAFAPGPLAAPAPISKPVQLGFAFAG